MDTTLYKCMEADGVITEAQRQRLTQISVGLPHNEVDLLTVIAATLLMGETAGGGGYLGTPMATESITSAAIADVKTLTVPEGATQALVTVHGTNIIFRTDGGVPAVGNGNIGVVNSNFSIGNLASFKFVGNPGPATIFVSYF